MRPTTHEYDTELLHDGDVVSLGGMVYRGRTVLSPGPEMFVPLERWAQSVADQIGGPVSWRASSDGEVVREGTMYPPDAP